MIKNCIIYFTLVLIPDYNSSIALGSNIFQYGSLLSGVFVSLAIIKLIFAMRKKSKISFQLKVICLAFVISLIFYCSTIKNPCNGTLYRYSVLSYPLVILESLGFCEALDLFKTIRSNRIIGVYTLLSALLLLIMFTFCYMPQVKSSSEVELEQCHFGDSFYECLDYAEKNNYDDIVVYKENKNDLGDSIYCRRYYYGKKEFYTTLEEVANEEDQNKNYSITKDSTLHYALNSEKPCVSDNFCIIATINKDMYTIDYSKYNVKAFGFWTVIYIKK